MWYPRYFVLKKPGRYLQYRGTGDPNSIDAVSSWRIAVKFDIPIDSKSERIEVITFWSLKVRIFRIDLGLTSVGNSEGRYVKFKMGRTSNYLNSITEQNPHDFNQI